MQTATGDRIVGRVLEGRYRVLEHLARGGMSNVYSALDERLDREVAVKVMSDALSTDPAFADRFAREARIAARLSHLNAVAVYDQGTDDGHVFLVMELVRGRTLRDLLREQGALSPAQAVSIMEPVLGALAAAHRAGLVHRDVKPENILLADDGGVKVADFGLARAIEADASSTRTGLMMGTVAYCPPEQISRGSADARSDVYSAGVVLFELLTGSAPYIGDSAMAVAYQHVNSDVPAPSSRRPGVPPQLDEAVLRATRREPAGRPMDAGAFLAELHDIRVDLDLPVVAVPPRPRPGQALDSTAPMAAVRASSVFDPVAGNPRAAAAVASHSADATTAPTRPGMAPDRLQHTVISQRPAGLTAARTAKPVRVKKPPSRRSRSRRRAVLVILIVLLLGLATGFGAWWLAVGRYHTVPALVGQSQSAATELLRTDGFSVDPAVDQQYSETLATGIVITTDPGAGSHVLGGKFVKLVVSKGQERFLVPSVAGQSYSQAQQAFDAIPIQLVRSDAADDTGKIPTGQAIGTDPAAGAKVKRGQVITVFVSTGPPVITVPDVKNKTKVDANSTLTQAGFTAAFTQDFSDTVPTGMVLSQSPDGGTAVKFSTVHVVVSKGPPLVTLPQIPNGTPIGEAKKLLQDLGLKVKVEKAFGGFLGQVVGMNPSAGTQVAKGSEVTLTSV